MEESLAEKLEFDKNITCLQLIQSTKKYKLSIVNQWNLIDSIYTIYNENVNFNLYDCKLLHTPGMDCTMENYTVAYEKILKLYASFKDQTFYYIAERQNRCIFHDSEFPELDLSKLNIDEKKLCGFTVVFFGNIALSNAERKEFIDYVKKNNIYNGKFNISMLDKGQFKNAFDNLRTALYKLAKSTDCNNGTIQTFKAARINILLTPGINTDEVTFIYNHSKSKFDILKGQTFYYIADDGLYHDSEKPYIKKYINLFDLKKHNEYILGVVIIYGFVIVGINNMLNNKVLVKQLIAEKESDDLIKKYKEHMHSDNKIIY